jgi:arsenate reductase (thioredoxin)
MAEGLLRSLGHGAFEALSAGIVATQVRPEAVIVMREIGIDISGQESKTPQRYLDEPTDTVVTVCDEANEVCPVFPKARNRIHWSIPDPSHVQGSESERLAAFRKARDELRERIQAEFLSQE